MNNTEEQDDLWQLLGKARPTVVSPFFSRNVLREIRLTPRKKEGAFSWLRARWRAASLAAAALALLAVNVGHYWPRPETQRPPAEIADYEVINHLDELLAYEQNSIWVDDSSQ